jgi:hypothetical protein
MGFMFLPRGHADINNCHGTYIGDHPGNFRPQEAHKKTGAVTNDMPKQYQDDA